MKEQAIIQTAETERLSQLAAELRRMIFRTICDGGGGHIPACFSLAELLTVLYHAVLRITPESAEDPDRDRLVLSKGHAAVALYAVLTQRGFLQPSVLRTYGSGGTILGGHPDRLKVPGVEASTGALGHGLAFGAGMALAGKMNHRGYRTFVILGDGECQEGSVWEAAMFAPQHGLDNLIAVVDYNKLQALDRLDRIVSMEPMADKWRSFGWAVREVDGHDLDALVETFGMLPFEEGRPTAIIVHTVKGRGVSFMENVPIWHYRLPSDEEMKIARRELGLEEDCGGRVE